MTDDRLKEAIRIIDYCSESLKCEEIEALKEENRKLHEAEEACKKYQMQRAAGLFNDPIHGSVEVNSLEKEIICTPEFSRLKDLKQLGGKVHVHYGATHTRFEHSIGVCYIAGEFMQHLRQQQNDIMKQRDIADANYIDIPELDEWCVRVAGLCHDLGHGPFSHLFDDVAKKVIAELPSSAKQEINVKHEVISQLILKKILLDRPVVLAKFVHCGMTVEHVKKIEKMIWPGKQNENLKGVNGKELYLYEIVANKKTGIDVDKWDYFARDFYHLGVTNEFDWRRCMKLSSIIKFGSEKDKEYHIGFRDKELLNLYSIFRTRSILYYKALQHTTVIGVEAMIEDILFKVRDKELIEIIDPIYKKTSLREAVKDAYRIKDADLNGYIALSDSILHLIMYGLLGHEDSDINEARKLISRLNSRKLYECIDERSVEEKDSKTVKEACKSEDEYMYKFLSFRFASEDSPDPIKEVYFFKKSKEFTGIPEGISGKELEEQEADPDQTESMTKMYVSGICKPESLVEYRVRLYRKCECDKKDEKKDEKLRSDFKMWLEETLQGGEGERKRGKG